jgi:hypothetical protein
MAMENEVWDLRSSKRWRKVAQLIADGRPQSEIENEIRKALRGAWQTVRRQLVAYGFSLEQIVDAVVNGDHALLRRAYAETKHHKFITILERSDYLLSNRGDVLERAVEQHLDCVEQALREHLIRNGVCRSPEEAAERITPALDAVRPDATQFARHMVDEPHKAARYLRVAKLADVDLPTALPMGISLTMSIAADRPQRQEAVQ